MAIVVAIKAKTQSKTAMGKVINYVVQDKKTRYYDTETGQTYRLISGQNCVAETAFTEFMATKIQYGKDNGVFYKHYVQSFKPNEAVSPKEIHQMGLELAEYMGHTVNFRTYKESYKDKRAKENPKENWVIFENTHPEIIDPRTWETAQRCRKTVRRF